MSRNGGSRVSAPASRTLTHPLAAAFLAVLASRLVFVFVVPNTVPETWRDGQAYQSIARNLLAGAGYRDTTGEWPGEPPYADPSSPTARWMPGYPLFVAAVYGVFGENPRAVYLMQALLAGLIVLLTYAAGKEIAGQQIAVMAAYLYALDPLSLSLAGSFQTEQLFTALTLAAFYFFLKLIRPARRTMPTALLFGFVAGLAALTRNVAGLMFVGLCCAALTSLMRAGLAKRVAVVMISCGAFAATLAPWMVRNHHLTGQWTLTTQSWQTLSMANNDGGGLYMTQEGLAAMPHTTIEQSETEREAIYKNFLIKWIGENRGEFLSLCALRAVAFWSPLPTYVTGLVGLVAASFNILLFTLALLYALSRQSRDATLWPCYMVFATFTIGYSVALVTTRFRLPLYPLVEIMAAGGVLTLSNLWCRRADGQRLRRT